MSTIALRDDHITLAQALKVAGITDSGGQAKNVVREGTVTVNGLAVTEPGRKLVAGDRFRVGAGPEWSVGREASA